MSQDEQQALLEAVRLMKDRITALEAALAPFGEAYRMHRSERNEPTRFKHRIALSLGMMDWERVAATLNIDLTEEAPQLTEEP